MTDIRARIAKVLADQFANCPKPQRDYATQAVIEALDLREQFSVSSGDRRQFEPFERLEDAERALETALSNNRRWLKSHTELPVWALEPHIEHRYFTPWETPAPAAPVPSNRKANQ